MTDQNKTYDVLVLDDMLERHDGFIYAFRRINEAAGYERYRLSHARTAAHANEKLAQRRFDLVFLDHDLSLEDIMVEPGVPSVEETGMVTATYIATLPAELRPHVVLAHSCNPHGAYRMRSTVADAGIHATEMAFPWLMQTMRLRLDYIDALMAQAGG
jgi:CheY-like chemotaxis protein